MTGYTLLQEDHRFLTELFSQLQDETISKDKFRQLVSTYIPFPQLEIEERGREGERGREREKEGEGEGEE